MKRQADNKAAHNQAAAACSSCRGDSHKQAAAARNRNCSRMLFPHPAAVVSPDLEASLPAAADTAHLAHMDSVGHTADSAVQMPPETREHSGALYTADTAVPDRRDNSADRVY